MTIPINALALKKVLSNPVFCNVSGILQIILHSSPTVFKWILGLLFLINIRSWPLVWHWKVLVVPVYEIRLRYWAFLARNLVYPKKKQLQLKDQWLQGLCPVGEDPLKFTVAVKGWAGPDDCDFNWHLSNSCYPKTLDSGRFRAALKICPTFFRAGGWMPLAATHFKFIKEIPIFATYEMRMNIAAWDNKWLFVVVRFVTPKNKNKSKSRNAIGNGTRSSSEEKIIPSGDSAPFPSLHTPAQPSGSSTPALSLNGSAINLTGLSSDLQGAANYLSHLVPSEEPDGATLNCISVSELCFKIGRITIPPALVLACEGFASSPSPTDPQHTPYSRSNPPPHFLKAQEMQNPDLPYGHVKTLQKFLRSGWRDVPENERWWEHAFDGVVEEQRKRNLEIVKGVRTGMEGAMCTY